ncbi:C39 family peptidase [Kitasatospora sp. HPMI-4]|uniref:C39 family peptidase n=1 Tax=Kitasatospora sp. HPMI-4 TaxID=3448443 RepID=UPI003F19AB0F
MHGFTSRRTLFTAALASAAGTVVPALHAAPALGRTMTRSPMPEPERPRYPVEYHAWTTAADWCRGGGPGVGVMDGDRPGVAITTPVGTVDYQDPHTGTSSPWEYATWTSPVRELATPATELVAAWNAHTPVGTWIAVELRGGYSDGGTTPWYVMGRWAASDQDVRRTSVDHQQDGRSRISTDTFAIDAPDSGLRLVSYTLRLTLYRRPGSELTPTVRRLGAMASDLPDRFEVPASVPGVGRGRELAVPRYSQEIHKGQYPQYNNGGEAWCSPTSSQMVIEYWGHRPTVADLSWVDPAYPDPQVCQAARATYDNQYRGCGNWPFNAAYAATYHDLQAVITRLASLTDLERLIHAGIPVITSQSFLKSELEGAGYDTEGHLMAVIGFTGDGDVIANDPASPGDDQVRRVYRRRQFENNWLRTRRYDANGQVAGGSGGVCYVYWPTRSTPGQQRALRDVGIS